MSCKKNRVGEPMIDRAVISLNGARVTFELVRTVDIIVETLDDEHDPVDGWKRTVELGEIESLSELLKKYWKATG